MKKMMKTASAALLSVMVLAACSNNNTSSGNASSESSAQSEQESVNMTNPWTETKDLEEAVKGSGVEFDPPQEINPYGLEYPMSFFKYEYMEGTIAAYYENVNDELIIRKSTKFEGKEDLAGVYETYTKTWEESFKGLAVTCEGDGTLISVASFSVDDTHYTITFDPAQEDRGLTADQLSSIIMEMQ